MGGFGLEDSAGVTVAPGWMFYLLNRLELPMRATWEDWSALTESSISITAADCRDRYGAWQDEMV